MFDLVGDVSAVLSAELEAFAGIGREFGDHLVEEAKDSALGNVAARNHRGVDDPHRVGIELEDRVVGQHA